MHVLAKRASKHTSESHEPCLSDRRPTHRRGPSREHLSMSSAWCRRRCRCLLVRCLINVVNATYSTRRASVRDVPARSRSRRQLILARRNQGGVGLNFSCARCARQSLSQYRRAFVRSQSQSHSWISPLARITHLHPSASIASLRRAYPDLLCPMSPHTLARSRSQSFTHTPLLLSRGRPSAFSLALG